MSDESWENGLRDVMTGTAVAARVVSPPTDVILRKGRSSLRRRNGLAGSGVLGVVAAAVIAGTSLAGGGSVSPAAAPTSARLPQAADAVVRMGPASAKTKVVLYEDYRCPVCKDLNAGLESVLRQDAADGKIQIEYRPTDLIDRNDTVRGTGSVVAGNAMVCAADHGAFYAFRDAVYAHQTSEETDPFTSPAQLIEIAREVPGLDTPAFKKCVDDLPYAAAVSRNFDTAINTLQCPGMPCITADGQRWEGSGLINQSLGSVVGQWLSSFTGGH
jgi:protein-disulfide isomerase